MDKFSALVAITTLGGVQVTASPSARIMPKMLWTMPRDVVWPTRQVALRTNVLMSTGQRWMVSSVPRYTQDGSVVVTLTAPAPARGTYVTITVPADSLDVPIWWVGELPPAKPVEIPGTGTEDDTPPPPMDVVENVSGTS